MGKKLETIALIIGWSAVLLFTFYLVTDFQYPIVITEPILWIRIPEIIMGVFAFIILTKMIYKNTQIFINNEEHTK